MSLIIAIDGPAGAGKSTAAQRLAARLGYRFLDTGAMYRAATLLALRRGLDPSDERAIADLARDMELVLEVDGDRQRVLVQGEDVTDQIRGPDVTTAVSTVAALPAVRREMVRFQRTFAEHGGVVAEGRDIGTVVFPDADLKFYLDADPRVRAERRAKERGDSDVAHVQAEIGRRDEQDAGRVASPLLAADDAVRVDATALTIDEVVDQLESAVRRLDAADLAAKQADA
jgi:cytidylate kinase